VAHAGQNTWTQPNQDNVTFTTEPLEEDTIIAGSGSIDLWIEAESTDVDLEVLLSEIRPDGQEQLVQSGWLRASHRALDEDHRRRCGRGTCTRRGAGAARPG
jgi:uncharacterized protein